MMAPPALDETAAALRAALLLTCLPLRRRHLCNAALPSGMDLLLRVAGDPAAAEAVAAYFDKTPQQLQDAAGFFIEQILLSPDNDSYRTLGASAELTLPQLRQNFVHLYRWAQAGDRQNMARSAYLVRITQAWNNIKTPERRADYDRALDRRRERANADDRLKALSVERPRHRRGAKASNRRRRRQGLLSRLIAFVFG